jgi:hypothetical protein
MKSLFKVRGKLYPLKFYLNSNSQTLEPSSHHLNRRRVVERDGRWSAENAGVHWLALQYIVPSSRLLANMQSIEFPTYDLPMWQVIVPLSQQFDDYPVHCDRRYPFFKNEIAYSLLR